MWHYLKAAFWVGVDVPGLGRLPMNAVAVAAFAILGVAEPGFWLLGAGLETAFLFSLGFNPRFQKIVDAQSVQLDRDDATEKRRALIGTLPQEAQQRLAALSQTCVKVIDVFRDQQAEDFLIDASRDSLERLRWVYLKLLVARCNLQNLGTQETADSLRAKIAQIERDLRAPNLSETLRNSKEATAANLKERLANLSRKAESLDEIDSDLTRIESQVEVILEKALLQGKPQTISTDIELASSFVGGTLFGDSEVTVADLDRIYAQRKSAAGPAQKESAE